MGERVGRLAHNLRLVPVCSSPNLLARSVLRVHASSSVQPIHYIKSSKPWPTRSFQLSLVINGPSKHPLRSRTLPYTVAPFETLQSTSTWAYWPGRRSITPSKYPRRKTGRPSRLRCKIWHALSIILQVILIGDISSLSILGICYVVLNPSRAISAILENQSIRCSNRPHLTMVSDVVGLNEPDLFMDCNNRFRQYHKLFYRSFGSRNSTSAFNSIEEEASQFLRTVLWKPDDLVSHLRS